MSAFAQTDIGFSSHTFAAQAQAIPSSTYTSLDPSACSSPRRQRIVGAGPDAVSLCPGIAGYKLQVITDDTRPFISIISPSGKLIQLDTTAYSRQFTSLGSRAEWRMAHNGTNLYPIAVILRLTENTVSVPGDSAVSRALTVSRLVVAKVNDNTVCVVGAIQPDAQQHEQARDMADRAAQLPCEPRN